MINGERCTRACGFCQVDTRHPLPLSPDEPDRVAAAVDRMGLGHAVVTCVARDDLADGGAGAMAGPSRAIRDRSPSTTVEVLISDCRGDAASLDTIFEARPDVLNHNIETVARLQRAVRPVGRLRPQPGRARPGRWRRPGHQVRPDGGPRRARGGGRGHHGGPARRRCLHRHRSASTCGPSRDHLPVSRYWAPEEFDRLRQAGADSACPTWRRRRSPDRATTPVRPPWRPPSRRADLRLAVRPVRGRAPRPGGAGGGLGRARRGPPLAAHTASDRLTAGTSGGPPASARACRRRSTTGVTSAAASTTMASAAAPTEPSESRFPEAAGGSVTVPPGAAAIAWCWATATCSPSAGQMGSRVARRRREEGQQVDVDAGAHGDRPRRRRPAWSRRSR